MTMRTAPRSVLYTAARKKNVKVFSILFRTQSRQAQKKTRGIEKTKSKNHYFLTVSDNIKELPT